MCSSGSREVSNVPDLPARSSCPELISTLLSRVAQAAQSILPAHCACPHSQASSEPVFSVSQCGLQYRLSFPTKQLQPACAHRFFLLSSIEKSFPFGCWEIVLVTYRFV